jgi:hypothetical protein
MNHGEVGDKVVQREPVFEQYDGGMQGRRKVAVHEQVGNITAVFGGHLLQSSRADKEL